MGFTTKAPRHQEKSQFSLFDGGGELLGPEFEREEGEEAVGVVAGAGEVFVEEGIEGLGLQVGADETVAGGEEVGKVVAEIGFEPLADGDGEAFFGAGENGGWEEVGEGVAEEGFAL